MWDGAVVLSQLLTATDILQRDLAQAQAESEAAQQPQQVGCAWREGVCVWQWWVGGGGGGDGVCNVHARELIP